MQTRTAASAGAPRSYERKALQRDLAELDRKGWHLNRERRDWKDSIFQIDMARQALHESRLVFNSGRTMQSGTPHITIDNHNLGIQAGKDGAQIYGCRRLSFARQSTGDQQELGYRACRE